MATKQSELVKVKPISLATTEVRIEGLSELIMHQWSEKAKKEMLSNMQKNKQSEIGPVKTKKREDKCPVDDFIQSMYWITKKPSKEAIEKMDEVYAKLRDETNEASGYSLYELAERAGCLEEVEGARFGFPAKAFKAAAISGAYRKHWTPDKMSLRGVFFILGDYEDLVEIKGAVPVIREDPVRVGKDGTDLRYRGSFQNWYADLQVQFDQNGPYSPEDIINYINAGGFMCGVGEWRVEKDGDAGMFQVATN